MAQTPISASVLYNSTTPTTIYTVPTGKTAVVKGVLASSLTTTVDTVTLNKVSGGTTYPLVQNQASGYITQSGTYYVVNGVQTINLLQSPITLAAGDSISISTTTGSYYKTPLANYTSTNKIGNIAYLNGNYIVVGQDTTTGYGLILTSTDGITYTQRSFPFSFSLTNVTYGNGYYVVCNDTGGAIHYSTDLVTWTQVSLPSTVSCYAITYGGGKFVTGGGSGRSYYATTTPLSWTLATVFNTNTIYAISYIGTNYFYGNSGVSYYTADFSTYTQPYVYMIGGNSAGRSGNFIVSNNKIMATNALVAGTYPNTFMTTSTNGVSWSNVTTTSNSMASYNTYMAYCSNGGYMCYRYYNTGTNYYLYSSDGVTWNQDNFGALNYSTSNGYQIHKAGYDNTTNTNVNNKVLGYMYAGNATMVFCYNMGTNGSLNSIQFQFSSSTISGGTASVQQVPYFVGNPYDESWIGVVYYSNGGTYTISHFYGGSPTSGADGQFTQGAYNSGYGQGYACSAGVVPASNRYLAGTTSGWVYYSDSYNAGFNTVLIGSPSYYTNPPGIVWGDIAGNYVCGFARGGESASSPLVILWANGQIAVSTNQGATFTQKYIGANSFAAMNNFGGSPIKYNNGTFVAINQAGTVLTSTDGFTWVTMPSAVNSIYNLNSQNVLLCTTGIVTSPTGNVTTFTPKSSATWGPNASANRMAYVGSTYYLMYNASLYSSSDLITWTSKSFNSTQINNSTYFPNVTYSGIAYSGTGSSIAVSAALPGSVTSSVGYVGKVFNPTTDIYVGNATASIVQID